MHLLNFQANNSVLSQHPPTLGRTPFFLTTELRHCFSSAHSWRLFFAVMVDNSLTCPSWGFQQLLCDLNSKLVHRFSFCPLLVQCQHSEVFCMTRLPLCCNTTKTSLKGAMKTWWFLLPTWWIMLHLINGCLCPGLGELWELTHSTPTEATLLHATSKAGLQQNKQAGSEQCLEKYC